MILCWLSLRRKAILQQKIGNFHSKMFHFSIFEYFSNLIIKVGRKCRWYCYPIISVYDSHIELHINDRQFPVLRHHLRVTTSLGRCNSARKPRSFQKMHFLKYFSSILVVFRLFVTIFNVFSLQNFRSFSIFEILNFSIFR